MLLDGYAMIVAKVCFWSYGGGNGGIVAAVVDWQWGGESGDHFLSSY
jgi:hypothetical protein